MSSYPTQIDNSDTLSVGADRIGSYTLETTLTAACTSSDTTIAVADAIGPGFAAAAMHLRIGDEIVKYTGRTATTFTGLSRGLGSTAAAHAAGTPVRATFTWLQLLAMQQAIIAIENVIGAAGAYNFAAANHTHAAMVGATSGSAGAAGFVPAPAAGDQAKVLSGAGTYVAQSGGAANAAALPSDPVGGIAATNVQAAIAELDSEKAGVGHTHAGTAISLTASGTMSSGNAQDLVAALYANKADKTITINAGAGASGGGPLSSNVTITIDVRTVHGRTGNVVAAAGDYKANQVDLFSSISGISASTVQQALDAINTRVANVESNLSGNYYTKSSIDSFIASKSSSTHYHIDSASGNTTGPIG